MCSKGNSLRNCRKIYLELNPFWSFTKIDVSNFFKIRQSQKLMLQKTFRIFPTVEKINVAKINAALKGVFRISQTSCAIE